MNKISPDEISKIISQQIESYGRNVEVDNIGTVLQVGDGIARVYGLKNVQAEEMVEFSSGIKGILIDNTQDKL